MLRIALALLLLADGVSAQQPAVTPAKQNAPSATQAMVWVAISGQAAELAVGGDGAVFAVNEQGMVWLRRPGDSVSWVKLPGTFQRIAAVSEKQAWAIGEKGEVYAYNGTGWRGMGERFPIRAIDIGASINNAVFAVTTAGRLVALDDRRGVIEFPDAPQNLVRVAVDDRDFPWTVERDGRVSRYDGRKWIALRSLRARDIDAGNGGIWLVGEDDALITLDSDGQNPRRIAAHTAVVASAPGGLPWIATADGRIYANNPDTGRARGTSRAEREQVFTQLLNWQRVRGSARQIAISPNGAVLALGRDGEIWQWRSRNDWGRLPGSFERIALDSTNTPWGLDADGRILRYQGSYWEEIPGKARDITASADGNVWIAQPDGKIARWRSRQRDWQTVAPAPGAGIRRVGVTATGQLWIVDTTGTVARRVGKKWKPLPGVEAVDLAIGPEGSVFVADADKRLWRWDTAGQRWERLNGEAASVAVGPRGKPWVTTQEATILASAFFDELPDSRVKDVSAAAASAAATAAKMGIGQPAGTLSGVVGSPGVGSGAPQGRLDEPLQYRKLDGNARDIAIGPEGSVFVVTFDGGLARWNNTQNKFLSFPGQLNRLAVAPDGKPWGVTASGEVFRHNGIDWRLIRNINARDVAIGFDGTVIVSGPQDFLHKYDPAADAFVRLPGMGDNPPPAGVLVAVDPLGKPWVIQRDGFVARCDSGVCERLPVKARSIDIGPEGSVVIVDSERILKRWNSRAENFERIDSIADLVDLAAVGPLGKPWLLSARSEVWASEFFRRDESRDISTAAVTAAVIAQSPATSPPVFTFMLNMPFDKITLPGGFLYNPWPRVRLAMGVPGGLVAIDSGYTFWNYNEASKQLVRDFSVPSLTSVLAGDNIGSFVVGKDGSYWISKYSTPTQAYRRQGGLWIPVPGLADCAGGCFPFPLPISLAVGPDGTVYATSEAGFLYRYDTVLMRFVKLTLPPLGSSATHVSVDPNGRFWVATSVGGLYEYLGGTWVARHDAITGSLGSCMDDGTCTSIGANGSVYGISDPLSRLIRWNPSARSWDVVSPSPDPTAGGDFVIAPDGRPWVFQQVIIGFGPGLYRAR